MESHDPSCERDGNLSGGCRCVERAFIHAIEWRDAKLKLQEDQLSKADGMAKAIQDWSKAEWPLAQLFEALKNYLAVRGQI